VVMGLADARHSARTPELKQAIAQDKTPDSVRVGCPKRVYGVREPPGLPVRAGGSRQTIRGPSIS
jgi:hypothetical protein